MVAALWGIFVWKEFKQAPRKSYVFLGMMFVLFIIGIILLANAIG
jgi:glucose uptake protein